MRKYFKPPSDQNCFTVVLTLRADLLIKVNQQDYPGLSKKIEEFKVDVTRMNTEELGEAIVKPADQVGIEVQKELVNQMKMWFDVSGSGSLPLIQYTLRELWKNRQVNRLSFAEYNQLGGVQKALTTRADQVYEELSAAQQQVAQRIFLKLTQLGEGTEDTRRQIYQDDLLNEYQSIELIEDTVNQLTDARLLVTSEHSARGVGEVFGQQTGRAIDVAHEVLIRHWPRLQSWLNEKTRNAIRIERKIEAEAKDWFRKRKSTTDLLSGSRLVEAEEYLQNYHELGLLSALGKEYIETSKKENVNRVIRSKIFSGYAVVVTFLVIATGYFGFKAIQNTKKANRNGIEAEALVAAKVESDPVKALTKAIQLTGRSQKELGEILPRVQSSLWETFSAIRERQQFKGHEDGVWSVAISPDGQRIVSGSVDKTIRLWDMQSGSELASFKGHKSAVNSVAFSPDGQRIVSGSADKTIRVWRGIWQFWLEAGCDRLRSHPVFVEAEGVSIEPRPWLSQNIEDVEIAIAAVKTCEAAVNENGSPIWSNQEKAVFRVRQGLALAQLTGDVNLAEAKFQEAQKLDRDFYAGLDYDPTAKAQELAKKYDRKEDRQPQRCRKNLGYIGR